VYLPTLTAVLVSSSEYLVPATLLLLLIRDELLGLFVLDLINALLGRCDMLLAMDWFPAGEAGGEVAMM
jgi:hypothetical protein